MGSVTLSMVMISAGFIQGAKRHGEVCEVFPLASRETSWLFGLGDFDDNI